MDSGDDNATRLSSSSILSRLSSLAHSTLRRTDNTIPDSAAEYVSTAAETNSRFHRRLRESLTMPGPLGFVSSGYFMGVIFMAFLLNRVQNIVVPSRHATSYDRWRLRQAIRNQLALDRAMNRSWKAVLTFARLLTAYVLPVDFSSTTSRVIFRIPSMYLLLKALVVWIIVLLQVAQLYPSNSSYSWVNSLGDAVQQRSMDQICWFSFLSACAALFISALTNGLEGLHTTSNAPFNLFGYSFLLHIYASPITHVNKNGNLPSRPDIHVLVTMLLPLLQLTMTHIIEAHKRYARARLVPTTITSLLSLTHFHLVTFHSLVAPPSTSSMFTTSSYPLPTLVPSLVETFLILIVLTTLALNALTQVLTTGGIRGPLVGLIGHVGTLAPRWDEDFGVVLFRLGTASVEATCVKGLGNEVGGVEVARRPELTRSNRSQFGRRLAIKAAQQERDGGVVELSRAGVVSVFNARTSIIGGGVRTTAIKRGLWNEIKHVKASTRQEDVWADSLLNVPWYRGLGKFVIQLWRLAKRVGVVTKILFSGKGGEMQQDEKSQATLSLSREATLSTEDQADIYEQFLRGEDLDEDEDDADFSPASDIEEASEDERDSDEDDEDVTDGIATDTLALYADLSQETLTSGSTLASPSLLLAHLTSPGALTRRRFSSLLQLEPATSSISDDDADWIVKRRAAKMQGRPANDDFDEESRRKCVICTVEDRRIICWPCRCLALCDDCRENLASRAAASKHICPCCRRNVDGFSRIYIP